MAGYSIGTNPVGPNTSIDQAMYLANLASQYANAQGGQGYSQFGAPAPWQASYSGGGASPYDVPTQYLNAYNEAKAANEQRYNSILGGYQDRLNTGMANQLGAQGDILTGYENRYQRGLDNLQGLGDQQKKDTSQAYDKLQAEQRQQLTSRGLTGSTILPTMQQGVERQRQDALNRVNEQLQRERLGYDASLSGDALSAQERQYGQTNNLYSQLSADTLGFAERRSDTYPDFNQLASLGQAYGAGGGSGISGVDYVSPQSLGYQLPGQYGGGSPQFANWVPAWWQQQQQPGMPFEANGAGGVNGGAIAPWGGGGPADFAVNGESNSTSTNTLGETMAYWDAVNAARAIPPLPPRTKYSPPVDGPPRSEYSTDVDTGLVSRYGVPVVDSYQQVVHFLGRAPSSQAEVEWALQQIQSGQAYA